MEQSGGIQKFDFSAKGKLWEICAVLFRLKNFSFVVRHGFALEQNKFDLNEPRE